MDMLVRLYDLPLHGQPGQQKERLAKEGIIVRRALAPEKHIVVSWAKEFFNSNWASEVETAYANQPITCFLAVRENDIVGFGCYEATAKAFFGPTGVKEEARGLGVGKELLLECLWQLHHLGYGYGIIGGVGPIEFYAKAVGATVIENSTPGIYKGMLRTASNKDN